MSIESEDSIYKHLNSRTTEELQDIYAKNDRTAWTGKAFEAIRQILHERGVEPAAQQPPVTAGLEKKPLSGIAGWLVLPAIGLIFTPFYLLYLNFGIMEEFDTLVSHFPDLEGALSFEISMNFLLVGLSIIGAILFFSKKRVTPKFMITVLCINLGFVIIDSLMVMSVFDDPDILAETVYLDLFRAILACAIWIPYFTKSVRVKNTFVK